MSTASERREKIYQINIRWIKDAIAHTQSVLNDQYESNLYCSAVERQVKVPNSNPNSNAVVAEMGEQFTVILSQNKDDVKEADGFFSVLKKELAHVYAKHCLKV